jgi:hypothetical protein
VHSRWSGPLAPLADAHHGVGARRGAVEQAHRRPRRLDRGPDGGGGLGQPVGGQLVVVDARDLDVEVDLVQERAGEALAVARDLGLPAGSGPAAVPVVPAEATLAP